MPKKLLIVSYSFPPTRGVGGRRWTKFAKYLKKAGYDVNVVCAENVIDEESVWLKDIEGLNVTRLPFKFPISVVYPGKGVVGKLKYYFNILRLKLSDKGNYFDRTIFWEKQIQEKASELITTNKIECVIVTSGPFRLALQVVKLKQKFPHTKFIVDFRDLWTEDVEITSFSKLATNRKNFEKSLEKETVRYADKVICVADELNNYFSSLNIKNKFTVIPNGFDPDDFADLETKPKSKDDKIRFVFAGTLYIHLSYILKPFFAALRTIKETDNHLYNRLQFEFIGNFPEEYRELLVNKGISDIFLLNGALGLKEVYSKINQSNYCLLFLNDVYNFALSTKFCEYISQRKKIIVVSHKGPATEFITKNKLGYWVNPDNALSDFLKIVSDTISNNADNWDSTFDTAQFSIPELSKQLVNIIEEKFETSSSVNKRNLLLTFDYELFLGNRSGTVNNCIIKPSDLILDVFRKHKIKSAIFFVDTSYLKKLSDSQQQNCTKDFNDIKNHIVTIMKEGHYVFPHLHPHWKDAVYDSQINQWKLEKTNNYRLHNLPVNEQEDLFCFSLNLIEELKKVAGVTYSTDSYRAGGWCIQPFGTFKPLFDKFNIKNDFSVLKGFKNNTPNLYYDYTNAPLKNIYHFNDSIEIEDVKGPFTEISISKINMDNLFIKKNKIFNKSLAFKGIVNFGDGLSVLATKEAVADDLGLTFKNSEMISVELLNSLKLNLYKDYLKENDFMHFISHPKMLSSHNIKIFDKFLEYACENFELNTDYKKMIS